MALDLYNALAANDQQTVTEAVRKLAVGEWIVANQTNTPTTLLRFAPPLPESQTCNTFRHSLELQGVLAIAGAARDGRLFLSGGSICSTQLDLGNPLKVIKQTHRSRLQAADTFDRHTLELGWMLAFQNTNPHVFPTVDCSVSDQDVALELNFYPAYSLGEVFVEGATEVSEAQRIIRVILETCRASLHVKFSVAAFENYVEKVCRRLDTIINLSADRGFYDHLNRKGAIINDTRCRPLRQLLDLCLSEPTLRSAIQCRDPRMCHGDLIPEDILYSRYYRQAKLIDPNPQISDPLADFAKLQMSFELCYDLALRDLAHVETVFKGDQLFVKTNLAEGFQGYKSLQGSLLEWLPAVVDQYAPHESREPERFESQPVKVMAALQALAIPIFHALQHDRPDRAKYFFSKGHEMLEKAIYV
jgi:hypothetical protein